MYEVTVWGNIGQIFVHLIFNQSSRCRGPNSSSMLLGADTRFLKGWVQLRSTSKKGAGGNYGSSVKKPTSWDKGGGDPCPLEEICV